MIISERRSDWDLDNLDKCEQHGPFANQFKIDAKTVWTVLHAVWGSSSVWTHIKKFDKDQNGRKVYRALYAHLIPDKRPIPSVPTVTGEPIRRHADCWDEIRSWQLLRSSVDGPKRMDAGIPN